MNQNVKILIEALQNIQSYSHDGNGICPYGCDAPYIAEVALVDFDNAEYASQQAVEVDAEPISTPICIVCGRKHVSFYCKK